MAARIKTSGDQFVNKVNLDEFCNNFINNYYSFWVTDVNKLLGSDMWKYYTKFSIEGKIVSSQEAVLFHKRLSDCTFKLLNKQYIPDGSRRMDIMVKGQFSKNGLSQIIVQTFALIEVKGKFTIKSTQIFLI